MSFSKFFEKMVHIKYVSNNEFKDCVARMSPATAMIPLEKSGSRAIVEACRPAPTLGNSYDVAAATTVVSQNGTQASDYEEFSQPFGDYSSHFILEDKDIAASAGGGKNSLAAFAENKALEFGQVVETFMAVAAQKVWGPVGGALARIEDIDQGGANGEIALYSPRDAFYFSNNMILQAAAGTGASSTTPRAGLGYVAFTDPTGSTSGTSTTGWHVKVGDSTAGAQAGTAALPSGWLDNDYLFRYGDIQLGTDLSDKQIRSIQGYIPVTNDVTDYLGASRKQRGMNGVRLPATVVAGLSIVERVKKLATYMRNDFKATRADTVALSLAAFEQLTNDVQTNTWQATGNSLEAGSNKIVIHTALGSLPVVADPNIRNSDIWLVPMKRLKIYHYTGFPGPIDGDGLKMLRISGRNAYEVRFAAYSCFTIGGEPWQIGRCDSGISDLVLI